MRFFKTIEEIEDFVRIQNTVNLESLEPFETDAINKYVKKYIGTELLGVLETGYDDDDLTTEQSNLLPYVQKAIVRFTLFLASPSLDIKVGESGYTTQSSNSHVPASQQRVEKFDKSIEALGWDAIEAMIEFLEDNIDDYSEFEESDAYTMAIKNFINSAIDFDDIIDIEKSRLKFMKLRKHMDDVEKIQIIPVISQDMADDIKSELASGTLSDNYQTIIDDLKRAVAYLTMFDAYSHHDHVAKGNQYLAQVKDALYDSPDDFPLWKASDCYDEDFENLEQFENNDDDTSGLFIFGGGGF